MKVLFFSNSPANAEEYLNKTNVSGGWLQSLDKHVQKKVDFNLVFHTKKPIEPFKYRNANYYPVLDEDARTYNKLRNTITYVSYYSSQVKQYLNIVHEVSPDIIHIAGTENSFVYLQKYVNNIPIVFSIQGNLTVLTHKFFSGIEKEFIIKTGFTLNRFNPRSYWWLHQKFKYMGMRERLVLAEAKYIIGRTDWDRRITKILAPQRQYFHNDEILRGDFYSNIWNNTITTPLQIVSVTGPSLYKGLETILHTSRLLQDYGLKFNWHIIGLEANHRLVKIAQKKVKNGMENLIFHGRLSANKIVYHLLKAHIYVMGSHIENSPNNLCEAMLVGMPIVATNAGGTASLFRDTEDGVLIQDGDPWAMAGSILEIIENYEKAVKCGRHARQKALERHNPQKVVNDLINIYKNIIDDYKT